MLTQREDVVNQMNFDFDKPIDTVFNEIQELVDISTADLNTYTNQKYINFVYNILNKIGRYKIVLQEWNQKYIADKNCSEIKPHSRIDHQELK